MQEMMVARAAAVEWFAKIAMPALSTMRVAARLLSARAQQRRAAHDDARKTKKAGVSAGLPSTLR
jgi:hypothetical protein